MKTSIQQSFFKETQKGKQGRLQKIIEILDQTFPDTTLALNFTTPLELLIALILAAQCTDDLVKQVTALLFKKYQTPQDWVDVAPSVLEEEIRRVTFYRNKAKAIQKCCRELADRLGGEIPANLDDLVSLPGVGRKTANVLRGQRVRSTGNWRG